MLHAFDVCRSNFPVRHKVGHVGNFVLLKFENKMDREILPVYILFPLEVVQIFKVANFVYYGTLA